MSTLIVSTFTDDLIALLESEPALSLSYGSTLFLGPKARLPEGSGPFVSILRTGGDYEGTHNSVDIPAYERPTAQLVARATNYEDALAMGLKLHAFLWPINSKFVNGTWWREIIVRSTPFDLPLDEKGRARVAFNIEAVKRVSPSQS